MDMASAVMKADFKSGRNGWDENLIQKMMELDDEANRGFEAEIQNQDVNGSQPRIRTWFGIGGTEKATA